MFVQIKNLVGEQLKQIIKENNKKQEQDREAGIF